MWWQPSKLYAGGTSTEPPLVTQMPLRWNWKDGMPKESDSMAAVSQVLPSHSHPHLLVALHSFHWLGLQHQPASAMAVDERQQPASAMAVVERQQPPSAMAVDERAQEKLIDDVVDSIKGWKVLVVEDDGPTRACLQVCLFCFYSPDTATPITVQGQLKKAGAQVTTLKVTHFTKALLPDTPFHACSPFFYRTLSQFSAQLVTLTHVGRVGVAGVRESQPKGGH